jgi:hypothetical protein
MVRSMVQIATALSANVMAARSRITIAGFIFPKLPCIFSASSAPEI